MEQKCIVAAGHICLDMTPLIPREIQSAAGAIFTPGRLITVDGVDIHPGGCVSNVGLALKKFGADVRLMAKLGADDFGKILMAYMQAHGAHEDLIVDETAATSYTVVLAPPSFDRLFLHDPGANHCFSCSDLNFERIKDAHLLHFGYPPIMRQMYAEGGEELAELLRKVQACQVATSMDLAMVDLSSEESRIDWRHILERALPYVDFFLPSLEELVFMMNPQLHREWTSRQPEGEDLIFNISIEKDLKPLAEEVISMGVGVLLIKCGAAGMYLKTASEERLVLTGGGLGELLQGWGNVSQFEHSYTPARVVSATGAGDSSIAAFLYAITLGYSWQRCLQMATGAGALCVEAVDALSGLRSFAEMENKIENGWEKQRLINEEDGNETFKD